MSNKYPVQVRMREMTKQEEILLKRKREIERKMKEEGRGGGGGGGKGGGGGGEKTASTSTKIPPVAPQNPSSFSGSTKGSAPNIFHNDGSFLEQFKKLSKKETEIKSEKPVLGDALKPSKVTPQPLKKKLQPPPWTTASTKPHTPTPNPPDPPKVKVEHDWEREECDNEEKDVEPDWFKDALRRAQAKARELQEASPVSLSACTRNDTPAPESSETISAKKRKSRWAGTTQEAAPKPTQPAGGSVVGQVCLNVPDSLMGMVGEGQHMQAIQGVMVTRLTRNTPAIISYAQKVFGSLDLSEAQWRQCEDQMKMNVVYQLLQAKKREAERLEQQGKVKYEYDSDEDTDGGTWEHKRRAIEMQETHAKAAELTAQGEGKHHIGDFLPPDELARFMEKYRAIKEGRDPDLSDYQDHKLTEENVGYRMLKSMGWTEGMGLGAEGKGITAPVNQNGRSESQGLGVERPESLAEEDDEYDAYRKRMMLAYRFRPNPLNNPRRAYY